MWSSGTWWRRRWCRADGGRSTVVPSVDHPPFPLGTTRSGGRLPPRGRGGPPLRPRPRPLPPAGGGGGGGGRWGDPPGAAAAAPSHRRPRTQTARLRRPVRRCERRGSDGSGDVRHVWRTAKGCSTQFGHAAPAVLVVVVQEALDGLHVHPVGASCLSLPARGWGGPPAPSERRPSIPPRRWLPCTPDGRRVPHASLTRQPEQSSVGPPDRKGQPPGPAPVGHAPPESGQRV